MFSILEKYINGRIFKFCMKVKTRLMITGIFLIVILVFAFGFYLDNEIGDEIQEGKMVVKRGFPPATPEGRTKQIMILQSGISQAREKGFSEQQLQEARLKENKLEEFKK